MGTPFLSSASLRRPLLGTRSAEDGKVVRGLYIWDVAGLLRSIGLLPDL